MNLKFDDTNYYKNTNTTNINTNKIYFVFTQVFIAAISFVLITSHFWQIPNPHYHQEQ